MQISPCKKCERKGCGVYHSQCELYQKYRQAVDCENEVESFLRHEENYYKHHKRIRRGKRVDD